MQQELDAELARGDKDEPPRAPGEPTALLDSRSPLAEGTDRVAVAQLEKHIKAGPDLHLLGKMFLGRYARVFFDLCVMLHFVSILISYALAGSQAYGNVFGLHAGAVHLHRAAVCVCVFAFLVIFAAGLLRPLITVITMSKGLILVDHGLCHRRHRQRGASSTLSPSGPTSAARCSSALWRSAAASTSCRWCSPRSTTRSARSGATCWR
jgi:hypothetical protein